ncbi:IPExxxVDY family protein [Flavobacterium zepuense]|uniref:IPExxxVDY family protein n=2 Tax=Flavobacterium zepuense TaxID=2593302 RepID=A0A552UW93_9FLAO|nr:IPExxxVDY family protein [Flavobacterium zepuense]
MAVHKLMIDDFVSVDYGLVAIHSSLEDCRLAYFINRHLELRLERCPKDVSFKRKDGESFFSRYLFEDDTNDAAWSLIQNKNSMVSTQTNNTSLFSGAGQMGTSSALFLPELKTVDYILKIEDTGDDDTATENAITGLLAIKYVATAYKINHHKLKSKNNLIF